MKKTVCIYMSTYNGEKYLNSQINSILAQNDVAIKLVIRDDGSSDNTCEILNNYARKFNNIEIIEGKNLGYANSFLSLLSREDKADYYALTDQDDIWDSDKLIVAIENLEKNNSSLYASSLRVVNEKNEFICIKDFPKYIATLGSTLSRNRLAGCTFVMDESVKQLVEQHSINIVNMNTRIKYGHDGWILLLAFLNEKKLFLDSNAYISYRRHADAVTSINGGMKKRICTEITNLFKNDEKRQLISSLLLDYSDGSNVNKELLYDIINYKKVFRNKLRLIFTKEINTGIFIVDVLNHICVLFNKY